MAVQITTIGKKKETHNLKLKNEMFTSSSILLNSSKQAQAPAWANPLKNFPIAL